jgi:hypothetical protein
LCPRTLYNLYTKSKNPEKLFVRVLQQNDPEVDQHCRDTYCERITEEKGLSMDECPYKDQIFIHHIHAKEAAGPTWARGLISRDMEEAYLKDELKPQDFCMSTDSHMGKKYIMLPIGGSFILCQFLTLMKWYFPPLTMVQILNQNG